MITKLKGTVASQGASVIGRAVTVPREPPMRMAAPEAPLQSRAPRLAVLPGELTPTLDANPFAALLAMTVDTAPAVPLRLGDVSGVVSADCGAELLAVVSDLEGRLAPRGVWSASLVRQGMAQLIEDAQEDGRVRLAVEREATRDLARDVVDASAKANAVASARTWHAKLGRYFIGGDVNAFVQQVLREAYLMGNLELQLYADRVKAMNELKKKIREEADRARKLKTTWAAAANGDPAWVSPTAYQPVRVDNTQMALLPDVWTDATARSSARDDDGAPGSIGDPFFAGGSTVPLAQRSELAFLTRYDADALREHVSTIEAALPSMNADDVGTFLLPLMRTLAAGGHTGTIVELIEHMTPQQALLVAAYGFCPPGPNSPGLDGFEGSEFERIVKVQRGASYTLLGDAVGDDKLGTPVTQAEANALITQLRTGGQALAIGEGEGALMATEAPRAGTPKSIKTVSEMDDYLDYLEDQMSSVGDDAQLANVDLQNCLQRQQQTLQLMSNIGKTLHDVCMAIIRNTNT